MAYKCGIEQVMEMRLMLNEAYIYILLVGTNQFKKLLEKIYSYKIDTFEKYIYYSHFYFYLII